MVLREMRKLDSPIRKVVIAGGGNIGLDLARSIEGDCQVKIIERDWRPGFTIDLQQKDVRLALRAGDELAVVLRYEGKPLAGALVMAVGFAATAPFRVSVREPAFDVMIRTTCRKSALRPLLSVSVAWSITCSRML